jgi:hypothetical protein
MGNKLYVTQVPTPDFKIMHPDNTVICQVKISRAAMSSSRSSKSSKSTCKGKKIIFFTSYLKASVVNWCFFFYLSSALSRIISNSYFFRSTNTASPQICPAIHFNLLSAKKAVKDFHYYRGYFTTSLPL